MHHKERNETNYTRESVGIDWISFYGVMGGMQCVGEVLLWRRTFPLRASHLMDVHHALCRVKGARVAPPQIAKPGTAGVLST